MSPFQSIVPAVPLGIAVVAAHAAGGPVHAWFLGAVLLLLLRSLGEPEPRRLHALRRRDR